MIDELMKNSTDEQIIKFMQTYPINSQDNSTGYTPLMHAVANNRINIVKWLLEHDANPNVINSWENDGDTALQIATGKSVKMVKLLLKHGAKINLITPCNTVLTCAAWDGNEEIVKFLLMNGANEFDVPPGPKMINSYNGLNIRQFMINNREDIRSKCINKSIKEIYDLFANNSSYGTPLYYAHVRGHKNIEDLILASMYLHLHGCPLDRACPLD